MTTRIATGRALRFGAATGAGTEHCQRRAGVHANPQQPALFVEARPRPTRRERGERQALATPSRVRILAHLEQGPSSVGALAEAVGMEPSALSHQLRQLRQLRFVTGERRGRQVVYALHDDHVAELLDQVACHMQHLRLDARRRRAS